MGALNDKTEIVYRGCGTGDLRVRTDGDTVWLTQAQICTLLGRERSVITKHINNALREGEVTEKCNVQYLHIANSDKPVKVYDLDVVISVGYRVKSIQGTLFRRSSSFRVRRIRRAGESALARARMMSRTGPTVGRKQETGRRKMKQAAVKTNGERHG